MPKKWILAVLIWMSLMLAGCGTSSTDNPSTPALPSLEDALPPAVALNIQNHVSEVLGVPVENIQLEKIEQMEWPDSCLGLPEEGEACSQVVTPGWLVGLKVNDQEYRFRVDDSGTIFRQEP